VASAGLIKMLTMVAFWTILCYRLVDSLYISTYVSHEKGWWK